MGAPACRIGDPADGGMGQLVGGADHETVKGLLGIERRVAVALGKEIGRGRCSGARLVWSVALAFAIALDNFGARGAATCPRTRTSTESSGPNSASAILCSLTT